MPLKSTKMKTNPLPATGRVDSIGGGYDFLRSDRQPLLVVLLLGSKWQAANLWGTKVGGKPQYIRGCFSPYLLVVKAMMLSDTDRCANGWSFLYVRSSTTPFCLTRSTTPTNLKTFKYNSNLSSEIAGMDLRGAVTRGVGAQGIELSETVRKIEESIPQVLVLLEVAVERCISFTGGSEADELILAIDDIMLQYISTLQETLKSLRVVCGVYLGGDSVGSKKENGSDKKDRTQNARKVDLISSEEEWSIVQGALQILTVADSQSGLDLLEALAPREHPPGR